VADPEHVNILKQGAPAWNQWRRSSNTKPMLSGVNFDGADLGGVDLSGADLQHASFVQTVLKQANLEEANLYQGFLVEANLISANLRNAWMSGADLVGALLDGANLTGATMDAADLSWTSLIGTKLRGADLTLTRLRAADMQDADLTKAYLDGTLFADVDLSTVTGLATCEHYGPSVVNHITLQRSTNLPLRFLRGVGLQEALILSLPKLRESPEYYSCFISYSHKDGRFAHKLRNELTQINIKCWFAPHDMPIGGKVLDEIDSAIRIRDKVVLILSKSSIASEWVEDEVTKAFEEERRRGRTILFPVRIDDAIMESTEPWASKLRSRNIGDFRQWTRPDRFEEAFERVRRDLLRST